MNLLGDGEVVPTQPLITESESMNTPERRRTSARQKTSSNRIDNQFKDQRKAMKAPQRSKDYKTEAEDKLLSRQGKTARKEPASKLSVGPSNKANK